MGYTFHHADKGIFRGNRMVDVLPVFTVSPKVLHGDTATELKQVLSIDFERKTIILL